MFGVPSSSRGPAHLGRPARRSTTSVFSGRYLSCETTACAARRSSAWSSARRMKPWSCRPSAQDHVHQRVDQHHVGVRLELEVDPAQVLGVGRRHGAARVDHDLLVAARTSGCRRPCRSRSSSRPRAGSCRRPRSRGTSTGAWTPSRSARRCCGCSEFHFGRLWIARTATPLSGPSARVVEARWRLGRRTGSSRRSSSRATGGRRPTGRSTTARRCRASLDRVGDPVERLVPAHVARASPPCPRASAATAAARSDWSAGARGRVDGQRIGAAARRVVALVDDAVLVRHDRDVASPCRRCRARVTKDGEIQSPSAPAGTGPPRRALLRRVLHRPGVDHVATADVAELAGRRMHLASLGRNRQLGPGRRTATSSRRGSHRRRAKASPRLMNFGSAMRRAGDRDPAERLAAADAASVRSRMPCVPPRASCRGARLLR